MADLGTLRPGAANTTGLPTTGSVIGNPGGSTALSDDSDTTFDGQNTNASGTYQHGRDLADTPSDFSSMDTTSVRLRYGWQSSPSNSTWDDLAARIVGGDGTTILAASTSGGDFQTLVNPIDDGTTREVGPTAFSYVNTTASKTTWDGAILQVQWVRSRSKGGDSLGCRVYEGWITGTYTAAAPAVNHSASGSVSAASATTSGTAKRFVTHAATGSIAAQSATLSGAADRVRIHSASGGISAQSATVSGTGKKFGIHDATGSIAASASTIDGAATGPGAAVHDATGSITSGSATVSGAARRYLPHDATGSISADVAVISSSAKRYLVHDASGAVTADASTVDGAASHPIAHDASGAISASAATIDASAYGGTIQQAPPRSVGGAGAGTVSNLRREDFTRVRLLQERLNKKQVELKKVKAKKKVVRVDGVLSNPSALNLDQVKIEQQIFDLQMKIEGMEVFNRQIEIDEDDEEVLTM